MKTHFSQSRPNGNNIYFKSRRTGSRPTGNGQIVDELGVDQLGVDQLGSYLEDTQISLGRGPDAGSDFIIYNFFPQNPLVSLNSINNSINYFLVFPTYQGPFLHPTSTHFPFSVVILINFLSGNPFQKIKSPNPQISSQMRPTQQLWIAV